MSATDLVYRPDSGDSVQMQELAYQIDFGVLWGCAWETTCEGMVIPCEKPAVAIRWDEANGGVAPVCKAHACRQMVSLRDLAKAMAPKRQSDGTKS
jgi:hypothetical protein